MTDLLLQQSPTVQTIPGENSLTSQGLVDPDDFTPASTAWSGSGNPASTPNVGDGPFGAELGQFQTLEIDAGSTAAWQQTPADADLDQLQCFSIYVKQTEAGPHATTIFVEILTTTPFTQHVGRFLVDGAGVVTFDTMTSGNGTGGVEDVGDGWYRLHVGLDVDDEPLVMVGTPRQVRFTIGGGAGSPGEQLDAYGARLDDGTVTPLAHAIQTTSDVSTVEELDLVLEDGDLKLDATLQTPILVSLFSDARALPEDAPSLGELDRRGAWWDTVEDRFGSKLWILSRRKVIPTTLEEAETWAREGLEWLIRDGIAEELEIVAEDGGGGLILLEVTVVRGSALEFPEVWDALRDAPIDAPGVRLRLLFR